MWLKEPEVPVTITVTVEGLVFGVEFELLLPPQATLNIRSALSRTAPPIHLAHLPARLVGLRFRVLPPRTKPARPRPKAPSPEKARPVP